jgi:hypothetical protein
MDLKTLLFFTMVVLLIVSSAKTGRTESESGIKKEFIRKNWPARSMRRPVVSAILEEIPLHNSLTPSKCPKRHLKEPEEGSSGYVGRPMDL